MIASQSSLKVREGSCVCCLILLYYFALKRSEYSNLHLNIYPQVLASALSVAMRSPGSGEYVTLFSTSMDT